MKFELCHVENFGSYKELIFNFADAGLTLIQGKTGSGKSTIQDIPCWILFGVTAKDGNVDEVRSWQAGDDLTRGSLIVDLPTGAITVVRIRGKASQNDLYWVEHPGDEKRRGKDMADTQKLLCERMGVSSDLYLSAAYFSEFSSSGQFFTAKAKDRREVFERVANLDLATQLGQKASTARKEAKQALVTCQTAYAQSSGKLQALQSNLEKAADDAETWQNTQYDLLNRLRGSHAGFNVEKATRIAALETKRDVFDSDLVARQDKLIDQIQKLVDQTKDEPTLRIAAVEAEAAFNEAERQGKCTKCGAPVNLADRDAFKDTWQNALQQISNNERLIEKRDQLENQLIQLMDVINPHLEQIEQAKESESPYLKQLQAQEATVNPFRKQLERLTGELGGVEEATAKLAEDVTVLKQKVEGLNTLYDLSFKLRGELLQKSVKEIQFETNRRLEAYFDSEFRVTFSLKEDSLEVEIQKSGHECVYRQLSKGQRGLLRLAFAVSIMSASSNKAGIYFDALFFDEALDGLDSDLKVKAFGLFEELAKSHKSVFVIDHAPEFQNLFDKRYQVTMEGDYSHVEQE